MARPLFALLTLFGLSACASAHGPQLDFSAFDHLRGDATNVVDIDLGPLSLAFGSLFIGDDDPESEAIRDTIKGLKAVHIRHFDFRADFEYPSEAIDSIRSQLSGGGWSALAKVRHRKKGDSVDVYVGAEADRVTGLTIVASGRHELTLVNVVGSFDLRKLEELREKFSERDRDEWSPHDAAWRE